MLQLVQIPPQFLAMQKKRSTCCPYFFDSIPVHRQDFIGARVLPVEPLITVTLPDPPTDEPAVEPEPEPEARPETEAEAEAEAE
eukprot:SAG22_NODE_8938_length_620_cov_0.786948_1_plen_83_part_01